MSAVWYVLLDLIFFVVFCVFIFFFFFFFNDTATTEIYTLSLHDALPIYEGGPGDKERRTLPALRRQMRGHVEEEHQCCARKSGRADPFPTPGQRQDQQQDEHGDQVHKQGQRSPPEAQSLSKDVHRKHTQEQGERDAQGARHPIQYLL